MQLKSGTRKCSLIFFYLRFLSGSDSRVLRCCLGFEPCLKKKKSKHKGHKSQRLVASFCYKASGQVALLYLFNSFALWLCNLQRATLKFCSMFCCIIQKESLKKNLQRAQAQCCTAVPVTVKSKSDFVFFWWCNWRMCCLDAKVGFMVSCVTDGRDIKGEKNSK